jgi:hypothetical protein
MHDAADRADDDRTAGSPAPRSRPSPAEELRTAVLTGREVRRGRGEPAAEGNSWGTERQLPADCCTSYWPALKARRPRAAVLVGLRITGRLNFGFDVVRSEAGTLDGEAVTYLNKLDVLEV